MINSWQAAGIIKYENVAHTYLNSLTLGFVAVKHHTSSLNFVEDGLLMVENVNGQFVCMLSEDNGASLDCLED